jgi:exodeoxyribonuclease V alpha subunit
MSLDVARVPDNVTCLRSLVDAEVIGATEVHVASFVMADHDYGDDGEAVAHALAAATWAMANGHDCASLPDFREVVDRARQRRGADGEETVAPSVWPEAGQWVDALRRVASNADAVIRLADAPDDVVDDRPLVLSGDRVYLQRLWFDECAVARGITDRAVHPADSSNSVVESILDTLLPRQVPTPGSDVLRINEQRQAADAIVANRVAVMAGGPGTGKTFTVARVLAALHAGAAASGDSVRIALAAPTGKAAQRLTQSIRGALEAMHDVVPQHTIDALRTIEASTLHALLGSLGATGRFRRGASNPLEHDIVIIDETSMMSVPLTARLIDALKPEARLVLVGDPDQLESIDAGAMLADLVSRHTDSVLAGKVVELTESHRFAGTSPIARLAAAVQSSDADRARETLTRIGEHDLSVDGAVISTARFVETDRADAAKAAEAVRVLTQESLDCMREAAEGGCAEDALAALDDIRILCAHRRGAAGVSTWNRLAESWLRGAQRGRGAWYAGRPVLVTKTDRRLDLFNGDTGVTVDVDGTLQVVFNLPKRGIVHFPTFALADVETCFAMTVHKSQGSEYGSVAFILPPSGSALIGRELAYTGVSRARHHLLVVGSSEVFGQCAASSAERMTGLRQALETR